MQMRILPLGTEAGIGSASSGIGVSAFGVPRTHSANEAAIGVLIATGCVHARGDR